MRESESLHPIILTLWVSHVLIEGTYLAFLMTLSCWNVNFGIFNLLLILKTNHLEFQLI